jgi:hypothetical protein
MPSTVLLALFQSDGTGHDWLDPVVVTNAVVTAAHGAMPSQNHDRDGQSANSPAQPQIAWSHVPSSRTVQTTV